MRVTMCLVVLLVLGLLLTPSPSAQTNRETGSQTETQGQQDKDRDREHQPGMQSGEGDQASMTPTQFLRHAMMANMAEVKLGQLATERASSSQVKQFAQHMIDSHTKANEKVKEIAKLKGVETPTDLDEKHKETQERLSNLRGSEFDRAYMEHMVKDHKEVLAAFTAQSKNSKDEEVRGLATTMNPELERHLQMATDTRQQIGAGRAE